MALKRAQHHDPILEVWAKDLSTSSLPPPHPSHPLWNSTMSLTITLYMFRARHSHRYELPRLEVYDNTCSLKIWMEVNGNLILVRATRRNHVHFPYAYNLFQTSQLTSLIFYICMNKLLVPLSWLCGGFLMAFVLLTHTSRTTILHMTYVSLSL